MKRKLVTISFVNEAADEDTNEDIEAWYMDLVDGWDNCFMFDVVVVDETDEMRRAD